LNESDTFWEIVRSAMPEATVKSWIVIAETVDDEGNISLTFQTSDNMTRWLADGMLNYSLEQLPYGDDDE
jgi:hypothetical protein